MRALVCAAVVLSAAACGRGEQVPLVTDRAGGDTAPANISTITLVVPDAPAPAHCLLSEDMLVVWPEGVTHHPAAGEVHDGRGRLLARVGETVVGGGALPEPSSQATLDEVDWAGCEPTATVLHQY
ncbi:hypothetical protein [Kineococcus sp. SYSU DK004]|uniref:hypothetical protein n=1 Tax=Kineococcus sp. SYSU DK004 TaxID=3383125 RepID=UPI003D7CDD40